MPERDRDLFSPPPGDVSDPTVELLVAIGGALALAIGGGLGLGWLLCLMGCAS